MRGKAPAPNQPDCICALSGRKCSQAGGRESGWGRHSPAPKECGGSCRPRPPLCSPGKLRVGKPLLLFGVLCDTLPLVACHTRHLRFGGACFDTSFTQLASSQSRALARSFAGLLPRTPLHRRSQSRAGARSFAGLLPRSPHDSRKVGRHRAGVSTPPPLFRPSGCRRVRAGVSNSPATPAPMACARSWP